MTKQKYIYDMTDEEMNKLIEKFLPVKKLEKDKYGEVFTPIPLINQLLNKLPSKVWTNPNLKWLDPTGGVGNFLIIIYGRLFLGLEKWEPNDKKRSQHIIGQMLYMVEINKRNCSICRQIFGPKLNLICENFLNDFSFSNKTSSFDIIIGNPPFQDSVELKDNGQRIQGGKNKLYERIFIKSIQLLKEGGYLSFIVPDNMFSGNGSDAYKILLKEDTQYIDFNSNLNSFFPGIQQTVCFFLLYKNFSTKNDPKKTVIENSDGQQLSLFLENRPVNPIRNWNLKTEKLIKKYISNEKNNIVYNRGKNLNLYKGNKYPIVYSLDKTIGTNNPDLALGLNQKKAIIFAISPELSFKMDYTGKYGSGPNTFFLPFETNIEGKILEKFFKGEDYKTMALATRVTRQYLKHSFIQHLNINKIINSFKKTQKKNHLRKNYTRKIKKM